MRELIDSFGADGIIIAATALGSLVRILLRYASGLPNSHWTKEAIKILATSIITHAVRSAVPLCIQYIDCHFNANTIIDLQENRSLLYAIFMLLGYFNKELVSLAEEAYDVVKKKFVDKISKAFS